MPCAFTRLAQRPERRLDKAWVDGSIPSSGTTFASVANANWHSCRPQKPGHCGFDSRLRHHSWLAQKVEQRPYKTMAEGSIPSLATIILAGLAHLVERLPCKQRVICSSQIASTKSSDQGLVSLIF